MKTKIIPFDLETAKKIQAGEIEGRIIAKSKNGYLSVSLKQIDTISSTLNIYHGDSHVEVKYGHNSMLQYLEGCNILFIELPEETPKHEFKPFDKVLVRMTANDTWCCDFFSHMNGDTYVCICDSFTFCIPYDGNENLVGTTNSQN
jgi:hypothetical protein